MRCWFHTDSNIIPHRFAVKIGLYCNRGRSRMSAFTESIAAVLDSVVSQANAHIVFMPAYNVPHENDISVSEEIAAKLQSGSYSMLSINDPKLYKAVTGHLSVMLCGRMHPAILAAGMGTPVVGLSYNQKFSGMFELLGQGSRCLPMSDFVRNSETARLGSMLRAATGNPPYSDRTQRRWSGVRSSLSMRSPALHPFSRPRIQFHEHKPTDRSSG